MAALYNPKDPRLASFQAGLEYIEAVARDQFPAMTVQQLMLLIGIVRNAPVTPTELQQIFPDVPKSSISYLSRILRGKLYKQGKRVGWHIADAIEDPSDLKARPMVLNPSGKAVILGLLEALNQ